MKAARTLCTALLAAALLGPAWAGAQGLVPNVAVSAGNNQIVELGAPLQPFVVKVTDAGGKPMSGVAVDFEVNICAELSAGPPGGAGCPDPALYGHFPGAAGYVTAVSDANGEAAATGFVAGSLPGTYTVFVGYLPGSQSFITPLLFQITQIDAPQGGTVVTTPALGAPAAALLALALAGLGAAIARKRRTTRRIP